VRVVTLGSDRPHPLTRAALEVADELDGVEHVDHITANDEREFLRDPRSAAYRAHLAALEPDLLVSAAYARIVPEDILAIPRIGAINVHPSLLPDYRGVLAVWWALYEGRTTVGVTIHQMTLPVDTGPILAQAPLEVTTDADPVGVWRTLGDLARPLLAETLENIRSTRRIVGTPQPPGGCYRSPPGKELHRLEIDWSQPAEELVRRHRVLAGNIPTLRWRVYVRGLESVGRTASPPGSIVRRRLRSIDVAAGEGTVVRVVLARPHRAWAKLVLLHLRSGRVRTLAASSGAPRTVSETS